MANVLPREKKLMVLNMLVEGTSLRSITRLTGIHRTTAMNLALRVGSQCRALMDRWMRNLTLEHLELDEIWTFVQKKQGRVPVGTNDETIGDQYLFYGIDQITKLIPCYALGKRNKETTDLFTADLASRLVLPDLFGPGLRPQLSTDGWAAYRDSIDVAFASRADHGVLIKNYRNADMPGRYGPPEMIGTERRVINGGISKKSICTSHIERANLSMRTFLRRFTRLALGFSKKLENLIGHPWTLDELLQEAESE